MRPASLFQLAALALLLGAAAPCQPDAGCGATPAQAACSCTAAASAGGPLSARAI